MSDETSQQSQCPSCQKEVPLEWGEHAFCSHKCLLEYEKKNIKPCTFSYDQLRELWEKDSKVPRICKNCAMLSSDNDGGDYCSNSWPICSSFYNLENFIDVDYQGDSFPFKKPKACFILNFWASHFTPFVSGVAHNDAIVSSYFHQNPAFGKRDHQYFEAILQRVIDAEITIKELEEALKKERSKNDAK